METIRARVKSFAILETLLERNLSTYYRGVSSASKHKLITKVGRNCECEHSELASLEEFMLKKFQKSAILHLDYRPEDQWEWLSIAQHHGMPTRLLDWTTNPLVAAYFACAKHPNENGAIYLLSEFSGLPKIDTKKETPFDIKNVSLFEPANISKRLTSQNGIFTVHPNPTVEWKSDSIRILIIDNQAKRKILNALKKRGIHEASLFQDLDGLARFLGDEILERRKL
ncbi:FRG domain-containing protein [Thermodesulfobacteriota bacterium]